MKFQTLLQMKHGNLLIRAKIWTTSSIHTNNCTKLM